MDELESIKKSIELSQQVSSEAESSSVSKSEMELTACQEENSRLREDLRHEKKLHDVEVSVLVLV